jgi:outer membrane protein assembly factor BamE (lipoprotein component of BamABCDE complex)
MKIIVLMIFISTFMSGCITAKQHRDDVNDDSSDRITIGKAQREIKNGMPSAEVAGVLGSPNIVSTDKDKNEVWIYDKVSSSVSYSNSGSLLLFGNKHTGAAMTSQKTLTIIIKFNENGEVKDLSYRTSSF